MNKNWKRDDAIVCEELNGEALLVNAATGASWLLNASALAVWKLCDGRHPFSEEMAGMCRQFIQLGLLTEAPKLAAINGTVYALRGSSMPSIRPLNLGSGPRRRPSPRGVSGPG